MKASSYFVRFFYNNSYININLDHKIWIGKKCEVDVNSNSDYYLEFARGLLSTNLPLANLELNQYYYLKFLKLGIIIKYYVKQCCYSLRTTVISDLFNCNKIVKINQQQLVCSGGLFVWYKYYEQQAITINGKLLICLNGIEFMLANDSVIINENHFVNEQFCKPYFSAQQLAIKSYYRSEQPLQFDYEKQYEITKIEYLRYLITPIIMTVMALIMMYFTRRFSYVLMMVTSVISTSLISLYLLMMKSIKLKRFNNFIDYNFLMQLKQFANLYVDYLNDNVKVNFAQVKVVNPDFKMNINNQQLLNKSVKYLNLFGYEYKEFTFNGNLIVLGKYQYYFIYQYILHNVTQKYVLCGQARIIFSSLLSLDNVLIYDLQMHYLDVMYVIVNNHQYILSPYLDNAIINNLVVVEHKYYNYLYYYNNCRCQTLLITKMQFDHVYLRCLLHYTISKYNQVEYLKDLQRMEINIGTIFDFEQMGPHGLICGMTGSGKSVLLQTFICEISRYYQGQAVVVLIDFKGNALYNSIQDLGCVVSNYSNFNNQYELVLKALTSELLYRQRILAKHDLFEFEASMQLFPRLFIVIDELAQLQLHSESLINKICEIARVGRSLGIYLLLATQDPTGVITKQLRSNLSFFICLKVNSIQNSQEIIASNKAYYLNNPGEAYLLHNDLVKFNVFDYNSKYVDKFVVNDCYESTYYDHLIKYESSNYKVWDFMLNEPASGIVYYNYLSKQMIKKEFMFSNYFLIGNMSHLLIASITFGYQVIMYGDLKIAYNFNFSLYKNLLIAYLRVYQGYLVINNFEDFLEIYEVIDSSKVKLILVFDNYLSLKYRKYCSDVFYVHNSNEYLYEVFNEQLNIKLARGYGLVMDNDVMYFRYRLVTQTKLPLFKQDSFYRLDTLQLIDINDAIIVYDCILSWFSNYACTYVHYSEFNIDNVTKQLIYIATNKYFSFNFSIKLNNYELYDLIHHTIVIRV